MWTMLDFFILMFPSLVYLVIFSSYLHVVGLHERTNFSNGNKQQIGNVRCWFMAAEICQLGGVLLCPISIR